MAYQNCIDTAEKNYQKSIQTEKSNDLMEWGGLILGKSYGDEEKLNRDTSVCDKLYGF
ncbi:MAG: hypothetical protein NUV85_00965 [Candidatus Berkelbacteria bacterium]|nr:hypothetical protein [Candidatus Berkelbacteria bacterium]